MTIEINTDTDRSTIRQRLGATVDRESLRTSESRASRLEQSSQRRTRDWGLSLDIDPKHPTAHCDQTTDSPEIVVSGRQFEQPATDLDPADWDYLAQRALGWHEDGHVLFTDHDDFETRLRNLDTGDKGTAKQLWNALEDGAIEKGLTGEWNNAYDVLKILRANLFSDDEPGITDVESGGQVFPLAHATQAVLLDEWMNDVYDISRGIKDGLLSDDNTYHFAVDEDAEIFENQILPEIESIVPEVLSEPNAVERNRKIFDFIQRVMPMIADGKADGRSQMNRDESKTQEGMPDDASDGHSDQAKGDMEELDDIDPDDIDSVQPGDFDGGATVEIDVEVSDDLEQNISDDVQSQREQEAGVSDDLVDEIEQTLNDISSGDEGLASDSIKIPSENWDHNESVFDHARTASRPIAQILRNRLQQERQSETKRNQRRGRYTGRGGAQKRALRGESEIKERVVEPEEKDYQIAFVVDRSGSMGSIMAEAEKAMITLALALEEVGVETMIIEMYGREARLAKPFGVSTDTQKGRVAHGQTSGSTPLAPSVSLARQRLNSLGENTALVVVTDGEPDNAADFSNEIGKCSMPTLGVNLTSSDTPAGMDEYDRAVATQPGSDLQATLESLIQEVMF